MGNYAIVKMTDYSKGKIYKLTSPSTEYCYIGSTAQTLHERLREHLKNCDEYFDGKFHYLASYEIVGFGNASIELVEEYPCETKESLLRREREVTEGTPMAINQRKSFCSEEETRTRINQKSMRYYYSHLEERKENHKYYQRHQVNCPVCGLTMNYGSLGRHKRRFH